MFHIRKLATAARPVKLRFAPSPTGYLHLGGLRTALFNYLLARKWQGKLVLRIEDTDQNRLVPGAVDALQSTLDWAGLEFDEGPRGGEFGPYVQSQRLQLYHQAAEKLQQNDHAYACFCTPSELAAIRDERLKRGKLVTYDGRCRHLTEEEVARRKKAGEKHVVRFKGTTTLPDLPPDLVYGDAHNRAPIEDPDDFIILKSDGFPTYHLANVIDDAAMGISHVMRGEEWLPSTVRHILLHTALGSAPPAYGHLPLLVNADGTKLSKRTGNVNVEDYRAKGYEPEALINFLGLMGWDHHAATPDLDPADIQTREVFTKQDLIDKFDLCHVNHKRAAVDLGKLDYLNKMHLRQMGQGSERERLVQRYQADLRQQKALQGCDIIEDDAYVAKVFDVELPRTAMLRDMAPSSIFFYLAPVLSNLEATSMLKDISPDVYQTSLSSVFDRLQGLQEGFNEDDVWEAMNETLAALGLRKKAHLITPMRHALTGRKAGPSVPTIMRVLGRERSLQRMAHALDK